MKRHSLRGSVGWLALLVTGLVAGIVALSVYLVQSGKPPEAKSYTSLSDLAMDVYEAGVESCILPFDTSMGTDDFALWSATCGTDKAGLLIFDNHWDRSAYISVVGFEVLAGPNWVVFTDGSVSLDELQASMGGQIRNR